MNFQSQKVENDEKFSDDDYDDYDDYDDDGRKQNCLSWRGHQELSELVRNLMIG